MFQYISSYVLHSMALLIHILSYIYIPAWDAFISIPIVVAVCEN